MCDLVLLFTIFVGGVFVGFTLTVLFLPFPLHRRDRTIEMCARLDTIDSALCALHAEVDHALSRGTRVSVKPESSASRPTAD